VAIITVYFARLWQVIVDLPRDPRARQFALGILIAFLPAAVIGALGHKFIKSVLFETPALVCSTLILGGIILLFVDRMNLKAQFTDATAFSPAMAFKIGLCQCLAMIPGVSRSGSTIVGALLLGADKRAAAEFSFFLALPTMAGAFTYDLYKNWHLLDPGAASDIALGFGVAFLAGVLVVKYLLAFVSRHGYALFGWWRIIVGGIGLGALAVLG
jgi:undecaprenyl-diphosphatase